MAKKKLEKSQDDFNELLKKRNNNSKRDVIHIPYFYVIDSKEEKPEGISSYASFEN